MLSVLTMWFVFTYLNALSAVITGYRTPNRP